MPIFTRSHPIYNLCKGNICFILSCLLLISCSGKKFLKNDQFLLTKNTIAIEELNFKDKFSLSNELSTLYKQKPNSKYLGVIKRNIIYNYLDRNKNKKVLFRNTLSKQAEPPSILDSALVKATVLNMHNYMFNKGYLNPNIRYDILPNAKTKTAEVKYIVQPNTLFRVDQLSYFASDSGILQLVEKHRSASFLKPGAPIDNVLFQSEKNRLIDLIQTHGYAEFNQNHIENLELDTFGNKNHLKVYILNPEGKKFHNQYLIGNIQVITNYNPQEKKIFTKNTLDSITISNAPSKSYIRSEVLLEKIHLRPGTVYNKTNVDKTYLDLAGLSMYKFINIESRIDSTQANRINHSIFLSPHKLWAHDFGSDLNYTTLNAAGNNLIGISGYYYLKNRNAFKGGEVFDMKLDANVEVNILRKFPVNTVNLSYLNALTLPSFRDVTWSYVLGKRIFSPFIKMPDRPNSNTTFSFLIDYLNQPAALSFISLSSSIKYDYLISKRKRLSWSTFELNYYLPNISLADSILIQNEFLKRSLAGDRLFTSFFLSRIQYFYQAKKSRFWDHTSILSAELSGVEASIIDGFGKLFSKSFSADSFRQVEFSKFIRLDGDARWYYNIKKGQSLAMRTAVGLAVPFGGTKEVPYIKKLTLGGPQSLRAWAIREPGPGFSDLSKTVTNKGTFFAAGDVKLEANIEYRFDMFWIFKGALFLDAGNVWLLPYKKNDPGNFTSDFYKSIGIGSGIGLRMDLSFFIFRVDWGIKLRNTYPDENGRFWIAYGEADKPFNNFIRKSKLHLALNYPF